MTGILARFAFPRASRRSAEAAAIADVCRDLADLNRSTESDFMRVLESLQALLTRIGRTSEECSSVVGILENEQTDHARGELEKALERSQAAQRDAGAGAQTLMEGAAALRNVENAVARLGLTVREFYALGSSTRIECARAGAGGKEFEGVADEVAGLAADLHDKSEKMLEVCVAVRRTVQDALAVAAKMEHRQGKELPRILEAASAGLAGLNHSRESASEHSRDLAAKYEAIHGEMGELVGALQYHDITRQQIEHVADAMRVAATNESSDSAATVALLQAAQLRNAKEQFRDAVDRIRGSLGRIASEILEMAENAAGRTAGTETGTLFQGLKTSFAEVASSVAAYAESAAVQSSAAVTVSDSISRIAGFAGQIESIGLRMHRVSLNANVRAARLGADGAALAAIAGEIQRDVAGSNEQAGAILSAIAAARECAGRLRDGQDENSAVLARGMADELGKVQAVLENCSAEAARRIGVISKSGRQLSEEVMELADGFRAAEVFQEVVDRCTQVLDGIAAAAPRANRAESGLAALQGHYTMEAERAVHENVVAAGQGKNEATPTQVPAEQAGGDLGENVELF